jgi:hypothetical protein
MKKPDAPNAYREQTGDEAHHAALYSEGARSMLRKFSTKGVPQCL